MLPCAHHGYIGLTMVNMNSPQSPYANKGHPWDHKSCPVLNTTTSDSRTPSWDTKVTLSSLCLPCTLHYPLGVTAATLGWPLTPLDNWNHSVLSSTILGSPQPLWALQSHLGLTVATLGWPGPLLSLHGLSMTTLVSPWQLLQLTHQGHHWLTTAMAILVSLS